MTPGGKTNFASGYRGAAVTQFCPECGQPLNLSQARAGKGRPYAVSWRSIFLVVVGLFLSITFGVGAWNASQANQFVTACQGVAQTDCVAAPSPRAQEFATGYLTGGFGPSAHLVDRDVGSDLRYLVVGLVGLGVGLAAVLLRRAGPRRPGYGANILFAVEGLVTVVYGEILVLGVYLLVGGPQAGLPLTVANLGDGMYRALSHVFALVGGQ